MAKRLFNQEIKRITVSDAVATESDVTVSEDKANEINETKIGESKTKSVDIAALVKEAIAQTQTALETTYKQTLETASKQKELEIEQTKTELNTVLEQAKAEHNQVVESLQNEVKAAKEAATLATKEATEAKEANKKLEDVMKFTGSQFPAINTVTSHDSDKKVGSFKEAMEIYDETLIVKRTRGGDSSYSYDHQQFDSFVRENKKAVINDLETMMKKNGLLRGNEIGARRVKEAATTASNIEGGYLTTLSSLVRQTHRPGYIFHQFIDTIHNYGKGQGETILVPRSAYLPTSTNPDDWKLSGSGAFVDITTSNQNLAVNSVSMVLEEYGMGKPSTTQVPVTIPTFVDAYSMVSLLEILNRNLGMNYAQFEDLKIRSLWRPTSRVVYNDRNSVTTVPANVGAGDFGTLTHQFLIQLRAYMSNAQILPFADNCYGLVLNSTALAQLTLDLEQQWRAVNDKDLMDLTNILNPTVISPADTGRIQGYMGKWYDFHVFNSNAFATGAAGTEGVQNVTLGTGSTLTRSSYAFGSNTIGRGIGDPMEIRRNEITGYGRKNDYIWLSTEGFAPLDVDPTGYSDSDPVPQQLRVIEVRTTDVAV